MRSIRIRSRAPRAARRRLPALALLVLGLALAGAIPAASVAWGEPDGVGVNATQTLAAGGSDFLCGIRADLTLGCWGRPTLSLGAPPAGRFAAVAAGRRAVCALAIDSTMSCWGRWYAGGAPIGSVPAAPPGRFMTLDVADTQACAVRTDQSLACWGQWQDTGPLPTSGPPAGRFVAAAAVHDWYGGCAIRVDGTLACWGPDTWGEQTPPSGTFRAIESGRQMYCGIRTEGTITCWGRRLYGMGEPPAGRYSALAIGGDTDPPATESASISVGETIAAEVTADGILRAWGETSFWPVWGFQSPSSDDRFAIHRVLSDRPDL